MHPFVILVGPLWNILITWWLLLLLGKFLRRLHFLINLAELLIGQVINFCFNSIEPIISQIGIDIRAVKTALICFAGRRLLRLVGINSWPLAQTCGSMFRVLCTTYSLRGNLIFSDIKDYLNRIDIHRFDNLSLMACICIIKRNTLILNALSIPRNWHPCSIVVLLLLFIVHTLTFLTTTSAAGADLLIKCLVKNFFNIKFRSLFKHSLSSLRMIFLQFLLQFCPCFAIVPLHTIYPHSVLRSQYSAD